MRSHVRYYHRKNRTSGHIWQERYKSFIAEQESYCISLIRYIKANAKRAGLIKNAQEWQYGSLYEREHKKDRRMSNNKRYKAAFIDIRSRGRPGKGER